MPEYKLIKSNRKTITLQVKWWEIIIKTPIFTTKKTIEKFIAKHIIWIQKRLETEKNKKELTPKQIIKLKIKAYEYIIPKTKEIAEKNSLKYNNIKITEAKTRWWSCSSKKNLNFSYRLILTPKKVIDYVITHELAHLKEMNHSKNFWIEVEKMMPNYKIHKKRLKEEAMKIS